MHTARIAIVGGGSSGLYAALLLQQQGIRDYVLLAGGSAALFGFFAVPAHVRKNVSEDQLRTLCRTQFARLFGPQAATPEADFLKGWAQDPYTATPADFESGDHHARPPAVTADTGPWRSRLTGIASEWAPQFPGYLAGAIEAASPGVAALPEVAMRAGDRAASYISSKS